MTAPPVDHCGVVLHDARNGCQALMGLMIRLRNEVQAHTEGEVDLSGTFGDMQSQIDRISKALKKCG